MSAEPAPEGEDQPADARAGGGERYQVDARGAEGLLVGDHGTQINYFYRGTWTDGVAPPPLVSRSGAITSPYRGLSAFGERDAALFFGRESAATQLLEQMSRRLEGAGLVVVSGVSGAGKSSLVRAGVLPRLRGEGLGSAPEAASWPRLVFTPGSRPLEELAVRVATATGAGAPEVLRELTADPGSFALIARQAALARLGDAAPDGGLPDGAGQRRVLLVVDQAEQLFTQCEGEDERLAFITALHAAATAAGDRQPPAALVVLLVRADFEARLADYPQLTAAVQDRYLLTAMTGRRLRMAITQPAVTAGSSVDAELVQVLLEEVRTRSGSPGAAGGRAIGAGALPLLSHALDQAWRGRAGQVLTLADYERTGGIEGAVASSAQRAYDLLSPARQDMARRMFTRLVATTSDGIDTAARATRADLVAGMDEAQARDVEAVLEAFTAERLLTLAAGTVEISHEALLTAWPLLRDDWLVGTRADRVIRTRLQATAEEWNKADRDPSYLYSGSRLDTAAEAAARIGTDARQVTLDQAGEDFLHASRRAATRQARRRQGYTAILLALVVGLAAVAFTARAGQPGRRPAAGRRDIRRSRQRERGHQRRERHRLPAGKHGRMGHRSLLTPGSLRDAPCRGLSGNRHPHHRLRRGLLGGVQPGRHHAGHRRRRLPQVVEHGHRTAPHPEHRHRLCLFGGVQPGRHHAGHRRRRRLGPDLEHGHRTAAPHPEHRHRPSFFGGVQPGRHHVGHRRRLQGRRRQWRHNVEC